MSTPMNAYDLPVPPAPFEDDGGDEDVTGVKVFVQHSDGTGQEVGIAVEGTDPDVVLDALMRALAGLAAARGPEFQVALARRMGGY